MAERSLILDLQLNQGQLLQNLANAQKSVRDLRNEQKLLEKVIKETGDASGQFENELAGVTAQLDKERKSLAGAKKDIRDYDKANNEATGSIVEMRGQLSILTKQYDNLSKEQRENIEIGGKLKKQIADQTDELKELEGQTGRNQRNVGNYDAAINKLTGSLNIMGVNVGQTIATAKELGGTIKGLIASVTSQVAAQEANTISVTKNTAAEIQNTAVTEVNAAATATNTTATVTNTATVATNTTATASGTVATNANTAALNLSTKALKFFKIALISTGIGAIVVLLGTLVAAFLSTQEGVDAVTKVMQPLRVIFQQVIGFVQNTALKVFDGLGKAISNPKQAFIDLGNVIKDQFTNRINGLVQLVKSAIGIFAELPNALATGNFDKVQKNLEGVADGFIAVNTGIADGTSKLKKAAEGFNDTLNDVSATATRLNAIYDELKLLRATEASDLAKLNVKLQENQLIARDQSKTLEERKQALDNVKDAIEGQFDVQSKLLKLQIEDLEIRQSLNDTSDEEIQQLDKLRSELIQLEARRAQQKRETLEIETQLRNLNKQYGINTESIKGLETAISNLKKAQSELVPGTDEAREAYKKLEYQIDSLQQKIDLFKNGLDDLDLEINLRITTSDAQAITFSKQQLDDAQKQLDDFVGSLKIKPVETPDADTNPLYNLVGVTDSELEIFNEKLNDVSKTYNDFASGINSIIEASTQFRLNEVDKETQARIDAVRKQTLTEEEKEKKITAIQAEGTKKREALEKAAKKKQKAIAITTAIINGALAITQSLANTTLPFPASLAGPIAIGAATAANIAQIASQQYAVGGVLPSGGGFITGNSHAQGGVKFSAGGQMVEAEGGEIIVNKGIQKRPDFVAAISKMNAATGGVDFYKASGRRFALGGTIGRVSSPVQQQNDSEQNIANTIANLPPIVVSVQDIINTTNTVQNVEVRSTIG